MRALTHMAHPSACLPVERNCTAFCPPLRRPFATLHDDVWRLLTPGGYFHHTLGISPHNFRRAAGSHSLLESVPRMGAAHTHAHTFTHSEPKCGCAAGVGASTDATPAGHTCGALKCARVMLAAMMMVMVAILVLAPRPPPNSRRPNCAAKLFAHAHTRAHVVSGCMCGCVCVLPSYPLRQTHTSHTDGGWRRRKTPRGDGRKQPHRTFH